MELVEVLGGGQHRLLGRGALAAQQRLVHSALRACTAFSPLPLRAVPTTGAPQPKGRAEKRGLSVWGYLARWGRGGRRRRAGGGAGWWRCGSTRARTGWTPPAVPAAPCLLPPAEGDDWCAGLRLRSCLTGGEEPRNELGRRAEGGVGGDDEATGGGVWCMDDGSIHDSPERKVR